MNKTQITLSINRKSGKYEGRGAVPFTNQSAVSERSLSEAARPDPLLPLSDPLCRRFIVQFVSGHRYVLDIGQSYFAHHGIDIQDPVATQKLLDSRFSNDEVFRRAIRDFSKHLPVVYECATLNSRGVPTLTGHVAAPRAESAWDSRSIPLGLL